MNIMEKSAVEEKSAVVWLYNQLSINNIALNKGTKVHQEMEQKILEQAKQMEVEIKKKSYIDGAISTQNFMKG
jgi:hypothetical protein